MWTIGRGVSWQIVVSVVIVGLTWPVVRICAKEVAPVTAPLHRGTAFIENDWKSSVELAKDGSYRLSWKPTEERIVFLVEVRTNGYVGLGFSVDGRMVKADVAVGWVHDKTKRAYLLDCHGGKENSVPIRDVEQNLDLVNGYQNGTHTVLMFSRLWDTCDREEDLIIGNDTIRVIWSYHDHDDPVDETLFNVHWYGHQTHGSKSLNLRNPIVKRHDLQNKYLDFRMPNISVPRNMGTVYWCKVFKIPRLSVKHHIVGYNPLLDDRDSDLIHHMMLYECHGRATFKMDQYASEKGFLCYTSQMPFETESCISPTVSWAVGSIGEYYPPHVGLPIGNNPKQDTYYMLEIHYDNPTMREIMDSSGVRLHYTDRLRKHDGGIFVTGTIVSPLHIIPPFQTAYKTAGYCDKYCTGAVFPSTGVNSVSVVLHSHSAASKMKLRHFRQGEELAPIVQDDHYDFNYQQSRTLPREITIFPRDELATECTYNTMNRSQPTQGGYSTKQEMCLAYITYYPKVQLASCQSMNPIKFFFVTFGIKKFYDYDMNTIESIFLKLTDKEIKKHLKEPISPKFPQPASGKEFDKQLNEAHISILKQMPDYTIDEPEETNLFQALTISEPPEFRNKTFSQHLQDLPWKEIYERVEDTFYHGNHMTFCRLQNDSLAVATNVLAFPAVTQYQVPNEDTSLQCKLKVKNKNQSNSSTKITNNASLFFLLIKLHILTYFILF